MKHSHTVLYLFAFVVIVYAPFTGSVELRPVEILRSGSIASTLFFSVRLPHEVLTFFAGFILALGGLVFQNIFRNALMTPYTLGISSGAVFGAGVALRLGLGTAFFGISLVEIFGFFGAFFSVVLILYLARFLRHNDTVSLLLLGIALSLFYTSSLMVLFYLGDSVQNDILLRYSMGSLSVVGWESPLIVLFCAAVYMSMVYLYRYELEFMAISSEYAMQKGVSTKKVTYILLVVSSFAVGVLISITGPVGFVGLVVPHIVAKIYRCTLSYRLFVTAFFGGVFLVVCDMLSRILQTQSELPIGIVTAFVGAPFFIYLIVKK